MRTVTTYVPLKVLSFALAIIVSCSVSPSSAVAQTAEVTGVVRDQSGVSLPGVNVYLPGTSTGTTTSAEGVYRFKAPAGDFVLVASAVGYRRERRPVSLLEGQTARADFVLNEVVIESGEVVVTASRRAQLASQVPASLTVIPASDIDARNVIALDEALRYVSGLQMQDNQVNLRGSSGFAYNTGSRVLLLVDGTQLMTPDTDGVPMDVVPMTQVEQIEVLKGPGSALYGSGALGGVINIITKSFPDRPTTTIQSYAGAYEQSRHLEWRSKWDSSDDVRWFAGVRADHARKLGPKAGAWISLSYRKDLGYMNLQQNEFFQVFAKVGWKPSIRWQADVLLGASLREKDAFLFWNGLDDALNPGTISLTRDAQPSGSNDAFSNQFSLLPTIKFFPNESSFVTGRLRLLGTAIRGINNETGKLEKVSDGTLGFRYGAEIQYTRMVRGAGTVTSGVSFDANTTNSSFFLTADGDELGTQPEIGAFAQWEGSPARAVETVVGVRYDVYRVDAEQTVSRLSPKAAVSYSLGDAAVARAAFGLGFRVPSLAERFTDDRTVIPIYRNPRLKPESSASLELGLKGWQGSSGIFDGLEWDVAGFWSRFHNFIEPRFVNDVSDDGERIVGFRFLNLPKSRIAGFEVNLAAILAGDDARLNVGYTFLDTKDDLDEELSYRPRHMLTTGARSRITGWLEAGVDYRYASIPGKIDSDFARFVPDASILEATHVTDVRLIGTVGPAEIAVIVRNLFDFYYLERPALLAPPRSYTLRLQLRL